MDGSVWTEYLIDYNGDPPEPWAGRGRRNCRRRARVSAPLLEQQLERVEEATVDADFVVQMRTGRTAG